MQFQILNNNNCPLNMSELDKSAADFWGVEVDNESWATPKNAFFALNWFDYVGSTIAQMPKGKYEWSDIIGKLCGIAAIGETSFDAIVKSIEAYKPFVELCLHWKALGYIPVSC